MTNTIPSYIIPHEIGHFIECNINKYLHRSSRQCNCAELSRVKEQKNG